MAKTIVEDDILKELQAELEEFGCGSEPFPREIQLREKYPGIDYPLSEIWDRNDIGAQHDEERKEFLNGAITALTAAATNCQKLLLAMGQQHTTTTEDVDEYNLVLKTAIYKTEELLAEMNIRYPYRTKERYRKTRGYKNLQKYLPQLLLNSEDCVIIWLPNLPAISHTENNLVFAELSDLLFMVRLPAFKKWHCDFIHVFATEHGIGVRDVDNYPYKTVIDALVIALRSKDSGDTFSCSMYNYFTDSLKKGCYIRIAKRSEKVGFFAEFEEQILDLAAL